jgi:hypothetical protein
MTCPAPALRSRVYTALIRESLDRVSHRCGSDSDRPPLPLVPDSAPPHPPTK